MDEQSLQDLLALISLRNVTLAARKRNISQPAYSRRLQAIEAKYGIPLVDRSRRPAVPTSTLNSLQHEIESVLGNLQKLGKTLRQGSKIDETISIAAVHMLSSKSIPVAINKLKNQLQNKQIRLKSANQDICFQMLMTEEVSLMICYETANEILKGPPDLVDKIIITHDRFVPVCNPIMAKRLEAVKSGNEPIPLVAYPADNFLGRVLYNDILSNSPHTYSQKLIAGLTNAVVSSVSAGIGMAWLPASVIKNEVHDKELLIINDSCFPKIDLKIAMLRLRTRNMQESKTLWTALAEAISETIQF